MVSSVYILRWRSLHSLRLNVGCRRKRGLKDGSRVLPLHSCAILTFKTTTMGKEHSRQLEAIDFHAGMEKAVRRAVHTKMAD